MAKKYGTNVGRESGLVAAQVEREVVIGRSEIIQSENIQRNFMKGGMN